MLRAKPVDQVRSEKLNAAMEEVTKEPLSRLNVNIPQSQYRALRKKAMENGISLTVLVGQWVSEYVSQ